MRKQNHTKETRLVENVDDCRRCSLSPVQIRIVVEDLFLSSMEGTPESNRVGAAMLRLIDAVAYENNPTIRVVLANEISLAVYSRTQDFHESMDRFAVKVGATLGEERPVAKAAAYRG